MTPRPMFALACLAAGRVDPAARVQRGDGPAASTGLLACAGQRVNSGRKANKGREAN